MLARDPVTTALHSFLFDWLNIDSKQLCAHIYKYVIVRIIENAIGRHRRVYILIG